MLDLRSALLAALALMLAGCSVDKAPTQPPRPIAESSPQPTAQPPAPGPAPAASPADSQAQAQAQEEPPRRIEDGFAAVERIPQEHNWEPIDKFLTLLKDKTKSGAQALEIGSRNLNLHQRKLLALAAAAQTQNEQDLYMHLVDNELLLYAKDAEGRAMFHWLADEDRVDVARALLKAGLNRGVNDLDSAGRQPLSYAHSPEMATALLGAGNDSRHSDEHGENALVAMINRDEQAAVGPVADDLCSKGGTLLTFYRQSPLNLGDRKNRRPIHLAALRGNLIAMDAILKCSDAKLSVYDEDQRTPLHYAAAAGPGALASVYAILLRLTTTSRYEVSLGRFVNKPDKNGITAFAIAHRCGHSRVENLLRSYGARPAEETQEAPECPRDLLFNSGKDNFLNLSRITTHHG